MRSSCAADQLSRRLAVNWQFHSLPGSRRESPGRRAGLRQQGRRSADQQPPSECSRPRFWMRGQHSILQPLMGVLSIRSLRLVESESAQYSHYHIAQAMHSMISSPLMCKRVQSSEVNSGREVLLVVAGPWCTYSPESGLMLASNENITKRWTLLTLRIQGY